MGNIIQRFAHCANQSLVLLQHAVKLTRQFRQFALRLALRDSFRQVTGVNDRPGRPHDFSNGRGRPVGKYRPASQAQQQGWRHHEKKRTQERAQERLAPIYASTNL